VALKLARLAVRRLQTRVSGSTWMRAYPIANPPSWTGLSPGSAQAAELLRTPSAMATLRQPRSDPAVSALAAFTAALGRRMRTQHITAATVQRMGCGFMRRVAGLESGIRLT
jgi:hypothetical protein